MEPVSLPANQPRQFYLGGPQIAAFRAGSGSSASPAARAPEDWIASTVSKHGDDDGATVGAGYTHAWLQAYLPGAGWVPFDPTNNLLGGTQLIRVGVARDPSQAAPISGSWFGETGDYLGMDVSVTVQRR